MIIHHNPSIRGEAAREGHLQEHEVLPAAPLDAQRLQLLVYALEVGLDIADGLLDLVVLVGLVPEGLD